MENKTLSSGYHITCSRCGRVFHPALPSLQEPFVLGIVRTSRCLAHSTNSVLSRSISGGRLHSRNFHQRSREHEYASCSYPLVLWTGSYMRCLPFLRGVNLW